MSGRQNNSKEKKYLFSSRENRHSTVTGTDGDAIARNIFR
jgi:hypothetical protein